MRWYRVLQARERRTSRAVTREGNLIFMSDAPVPPAGENVTSILAKMRRRADMLDDWKGRELLLELELALRAGADALAPSTPKLVRYWTVLGGLAPIPADVLPRYESLGLGWYKAKDVDALLEARAEALAPSPKKRQEPEEDNAVSRRGKQADRPFLRSSASTDGGITTPAPNVLTVVVNGQPVEVNSGAVPAVIQQAILKSGQIGAPVAQWELRTRDGDVIPHDLEADWELTGGRLLFLNLGLPKLRADALASSPHKNQEEEKTLSRSETREISQPFRSSASTDGGITTPAPNQNRSMRFEIEAVQAETLRTFLATHGCRPVNRAAVGVSPIEIVFRETSIAMYCEARCTICKEKVDLNDYGSW